MIRREIRRISPGVKIDIEDIEQVLRNDVLKREVIEGEKAEAARKQVQKVAARALRASKSCAPSNEQKVLSISPTAIEKLPEKIETQKDEVA